MRRFHSDSMAILLKDVSDRYQERKIVGDYSLIA